jgi:hypothetical protein
LHLQLDIDFTGLFQVFQTNISRMILAQPPMRRSDMDDKFVGNGFAAARNAPFGDPDGAHSDLTELIEKFVTFNGNLAWGGIGTKAHDRNVRVLVGKKGAGKTVYLRRLQASANDERSLYADCIRQDIPTTEMVTRFCHTFSNHVVSESWEQAWRKAILRSVVTHLLFDRKLRSHVPDEYAELLKNKFTRILSNHITPVSVYSQLAQIINNHDTPHKFSRFFSDPSWADLEHTICCAIRSCPPICLYMDTIDDEFARAPFEWLQCQLGLFYAIMKFSRDHRLGDRIHITICIRDIVMSAVYRTEHTQRYRRDRHIRILDWDHESILRFLQCKLRYVPSEFRYERGRKYTGTHAWLGFEKYITSDGKEENIEDFIIRHTRYLPRDIIDIGNRICMEISKINSCRWAPPSDWKLYVERLVRSSSREWGNEQLRICANQLASHDVPLYASRHGYGDFYVGHHAYLDQPIEHLKTLIRHLGQRSFQMSDIQRVRAELSELFPEEVDPMTVLWQNGLIGLLRENDTEDKPNFYALESSSDFLLPKDARKYLLHPCLAEAVGLTNSR